MERAIPEHTFAAGDSVPTWVLRVSPPEHQHLLRFVSPVRAWREDGVTHLDSSGRPAMSWPCAPGILKALTGAPTELHAPPL
jgi:hypothetical protein